MHVRHEDGWFWNIAGVLQKFATFARTRWTTAAQWRTAAGNIFNKTAVDNATTVAMLRAEMSKQTEFLREFFEEAFDKASTPPKP